MRPWVVLFVVIVLAGCARFKPQPLAPAVSAAQLDARRLDDPGLKKFIEQNLGPKISIWPPASWDLQTLSLVAFYYHPSLAVARAQWKVTQAGIKTAGGRLNPTLILTPGYDTSALPNANPWIPFLNVDIPLQTAGKRRKRMAEASQLSESAHWNLVTTGWQIRAAVRASLLDFAVADRRAGLLARQLQAQQQTLILLRQRVAVGELAQPDLTTAQIILNRTQVDLADAKSLRAQARAQVAQALGVSVAALAGIHLVFDFSERSAAVLTSFAARKLALCGRADVRSALADYAAAEDELRLQIAKQIPDVHFQPGYQFDQGDNKWSLGITFEVPLVNQNQGPIAEAEARRTESAARFIELQAKIIGQIDLAVIAYNTRRENLTAFHPLVADEKARQQSAEQLFQAGAAGQLDVVGAKIQLSSAALAELDAQAKFQQAMGALEDAVQQPLGRDFPPLAESASDSKPKVHP